MNQKPLLFCGIGGPISLMLAALGFQYLGDLHPCTLCIWQRWPHVAAIIIGILYFLFKIPILAFIVALVFTIGAGIAGFHVGVEYGWWEGLQSCTGTGLEGLSSKQLLDFSTPVTSTNCSVPALIFLDLSMAAWNGLASVSLVVIWTLIGMSAIRKTEHKTDK